MAGRAVLLSTQPRARPRRRHRGAHRVPRPGPVRHRPRPRHGGHDVPAAAGQPAAAPAPAGPGARHAHRVARLGPGGLDARSHGGRRRSRQAGGPRQGLAAAPVDGAGLASWPLVQRGRAAAEARGRAVLRGLLRHAGDRRRRRCRAAGRVRRPGRRHAAADRGRRRRGHDVGCGRPAAALCRHAGRPAGRPPVPTRTLLRQPGGPAAAARAPAGPAAPSAPGQRTTPGPR